MDGNDINWTSKTILDRSGQGNTGTLNGLNQRSAVQGKFSQALTFNGSSSYVQLANPTNFDFNNTTFTVTGWFKSNSSTGQVFLVAKGAASLATGGYAIALNASVNNAANPGFLRAFTKDNTGSGTLTADQGSNSGNFNDNNWHQFAVIFTTNTSIGASNNIQTYVDGVLNQQGSAVTGNPYGGTNSDALSIGARAVPSAPAGYFPGVIDDVRIYNRALSATEVTRLYKLGTALVKTN
jgi:hypothetical protein